MTTTTTTPGAPPPGTGSGRAVLDASGVTMRFGGLTAVRDVNLDVHAGEIVGLIGPNGAGKTTFFNCLTGLYIPTEGTVRYRGTVLPHRSHLVTQAGIARTFQNIRLFANMTVLENVLVGRHTRTHEGLFSALVRGPRFRRAERESEERAMDLLRFTPGWRPNANTSHATSPTANNANWRSPEPSPASPDCCCWTSPPRA